MLRKLVTKARRRFSPLEKNRFLQFAPPGHFYSPIPDIEYIEQHKARLFDRSRSNVPGIENHLDDQIALLEAFADYYPDLPFKAEKTEGLRYYFDNPFFAYADAIVLYSMLRHYRPRRVIEVGSGFSSAVMLDTSDIFLEGSVAFTFVEPLPERLLSLMKSDDRARHEVIVSAIQDVPLERFKALQARDVLFIDSSHVAKAGSDVIHLMTDVLPALREGVMVHFHDVFWPFEYPEEWIRSGRAWNENYILKAFLQFNPTFRILMFNSYLAAHRGDLIARFLPLSVRNPGGSLWLLKTC
jgi:predicted O-methyltransferase YrrM